MKTDTKESLRKRIIAVLKNQKEEDRLRKSLIIAEKLFSMQEFTDAKTVLFYASFGGEVDTFEMMKQALRLRKQIGLPRITGADGVFVPLLVDDLNAGLESGPYGIQQPKYAGDEHRLAVAQVDMVIVPGVAFDRQKNRLGRGKGYYDRFLSVLPARVTTVGLAFDFQIVDSLPELAAHDTPVSCVLTN